MSEAKTAVDNSRPPIEHELKTWQSYFHALADGSKNFELRRDDRDYRPGDTLWLRETEYGSGAYTGRETRRLVTYVLRHEEDLGLIDGFAILSLEPTQLSQALRELEAARSHGSALLRDVEHTEAQLATALRELGEARADLSVANVKPQTVAGSNEKPRRIQLKRAKGWKMPANTVKVDRTTPWGNPFVVGKPGGAYSPKVMDRRHAYLLFKSIAADNEKLVTAAREQLRGKNLACWCPMDDLYEDCCHAAVLLEIANAPIGGPPKPEDQSGELPTTENLPYPNPPHPQEKP